MARGKLFLQIIFLSCTAKNCQFWCHVSSRKKKQSLRDLSTQKNESIFCIAVHMEAYRKIYCERIFFLEFIFMYRCKFPFTFFPRSLTSSRNYSQNNLATWNCSQLWIIFFLCYSSTHTTIDRCGAWVRNQHFPLSHLFD